jgi:hypothetical protein
MPIFPPVDGGISNAEPTCHSRDDPILARVEPVFCKTHIEQSFASPPANGILVAKRYREGPRYGAGVAGGSDS